MPYADLPGLRIHYQLDGPHHAPVLVLSNSLGTDLSLWDRQLATFTTRFRVLRYDQRGHGASDVPPGDYTVAMLGADVVALLDRLAIARAHFCGISMGGLTGMWLGAHARGRIGHLVLANTAAKIGTMDTWNTRIAAVTREGLPVMADGVLARWFTPAFLAANAPPLPALRNMLAHTSLSGYLACCAAVRDADLRADLAVIAAPTLVIAGVHDASTTPADARALAAAIAGARHVELVAAHISNIEAAAAFNAAVLDFLPH